MEGGGAFGGVKTKVLADPDSSSSPKPPSSIDQNQFIFANQKQPGPANSFDVPGPSTLAEAADLRIKRLCLDFVKFSVDVMDCIKGAHALVLVTEWNQFRALDFAKIKNLMSQPYLIDLKNIYNQNRLEKLGFIYSGIGIG